MPTSTDTMSARTMKLYRNGSSRKSTKTCPPRR